MAQEGSWNIVKKRMLEDAGGSAKSRGRLDQRMYSHARITFSQQLVKSQH